LKGQEVSNWPSAQKVLTGQLPGHNPVKDHPGHYAGSAEDKTDFGGSGWKIRLDPKNDRDNYILSHWVRQNRDKISTYKMAWTEGDHPVWTLYTGTGSAKDAQYLAQKAEKEIGRFLRIGQAFQSEDTLLPGTKISGRFEIRGDERSLDSKRHKEIVDEIERLRPSHNPMKGLYMRFMASPLYKKGFPAITSGKSGVPGTAYYAWLQGNIGTMRRKKENPEAIRKFEQEAQAEIDLVKKVIQSKLKDVF
jgi:hypothetical protein